MTQDFKRRLKIFGAGAVIGTFLSILLFQYHAYVKGPEKVQRVEVVLTQCDLKPGDVFKESCVKRRVVARRFVPPNTISYDELGMWVGRKIHAKLKKGDAVRTVDFSAKTNQ